MDFTNPISGTASIALLALLLGTFFRIQILQNRREAANDLRLRVLERDRDWCNRNNAILIHAVQRGGLEVPTEIWDPPPPLELLKKGQADVA